MSALQKKLMDYNHHQHPLPQHPLQQQQQLKISNKLHLIQANNFNHTLNLYNINNNHNNCNNNYATPTASSVLKQRKQNSTTNCSTIFASNAILSPSKYRKCPPLSPLTITTANAAPFISNTSSLSSPSQQLVNMTLPSQSHTQQQNFMKLSPASPVLGLTLSPLSPNSASSCSSSVHLVRTTKTTRLRAAALGECSH